MRRSLMVVSLFLAVVMVPMAFAQASEGTSKPEIMDIRLGKDEVTRQGTQDIEVKLSTNIKADKLILEYRLEDTETTKEIDLDHKGEGLWTGRVEIDGSWEEGLWKLHKISYLAGEDLVEKRYKEDAGSFLVKDGKDSEKPKEETEEKKENPTKTPKSDKPANKVKSVDWMADRPSPQRLGTPITFKAWSSGSSKVLYKFQIRKDGVWKTLQDYSTKDTFTWIPDEPGEYLFSVVARSDRNSDGYVYKNRRFTIEEKGQRGKPLVVIDPGHGPGNVNQGPTGYYEYKGMWKLANYLKDELESVGIEVILTRKENQDPSLKDRGRLAEGADLFISLHSNAFSDRSVNGVEVYYSVRQPENRQFAEELARVISDLMGNNNRGAKIRHLPSDPSQDYLGVIRSAVSVGVPRAFLVENGFHTNPADEAWLKNDANLKKLARAYRQVICKYLGVEEIIEDDDSDDTSYEKLEKVTWTADKSNPQTVGTPINFTATATGGKDVYYKFQIRKDGVWTTLQDYSKKNTFTWIPEEPGDYLFSVVARDKANWEDEVFLNKRFRINSTNSYKVTEYDKRFEEVLDIQMSRSPQTDLYGGGWKDAKREDVSYYLDPKNFLQFDPEKGGRKYFTSLEVTASVLNVRKAPNTTSSILTTVNKGEKFIALDEFNGWYKVNVDGKEGWVSGAYTDRVTGVPREMYQFLVLSGSSGLGKSDLNQALKGKGILEGQGQAFIDASRKHNINELYLLSHAFLETGNGTSKLATGVLVDEVDGKKVTPRVVYNMFGVGARDANPLKLGAEYAYKRGWFTPQDAIVGGAEFIARDYINNSSYKQDTLYKMRWNPKRPGSHQYATDIGWAYKQTREIERMVNMFAGSNSLKLVFDIPVYK